MYTDAKLMVSYQQPTAISFAATTTGSSMLSKQVNTRPRRTGHFNNGIIITILRNNVVVLSQNQQQQQIMLCAADACRLQQLDCGSEGGNGRAIRSLERHNYLTLS